MCRETNVRMFILFLNFYHIQIFAKWKQKAAAFNTFPVYLDISKQQKILQFKKFIHQFKCRSTTGLQAFVILVLSGFLFRLQENLHLFLFANLHKVVFLCTMFCMHFSLKHYFLYNNQCLCVCVSSVQLQCTIFLFAFSPKLPCFMQIFVWKIIPAGSLCIIDHVDHNSFILFLTPLEFATGCFCYYSVLFMMRQNSFQINQKQPKITL